jgi:hypothetical protein
MTGDLPKVRRLWGWAAVAAILFGTGPAWAGQYTATFTGIVSSLTFAGFCGTSDFNSQCPSGSCDCLELTGRATGNLIGHTAKDAAEIDITFDHGGPAVGWPPNAQCSPIYATAFIPGNRDSERIDFTGSMCMLDSNFKSHAAPIAGTWGLTDLSGIRVGFGKVTGTLNLFNFMAPQKLTFSGLSANGP